MYHNSLLCLTTYIVPCAYVSIPYAYAMTYIYSWQYLLITSCEIDCLFTLGFLCLINTLYSRLYQLVCVILKAYIYFKSLYVLVKPHHE